jgi:hypothetical protein
MLPVEEILATPSAARPPGQVVGRSRRGRPVLGWSFGTGDRSVSLIGGAHADEPVGPEMLCRWVAYLGRLEAAEPGHPLLAAWRWRVVPHINPDGAAINAGWPGCTVGVADARGEPAYGYRFSSYFESVVRESPGDDLEFGFPGRSADGESGGAARVVRPEARGVAAFLAEEAPLALHASFHSMAFGAGPWFLIERAWIERTVTLRRRLAARVEQEGYRLHDVDRRGEKGFDRIGPGFCTRPDSVAMRRHFEERGDLETASLFLPSSMELARSLGGDPLTIVSEMPLFLVPAVRETGGATGETASPGAETGDAEAAGPLPVDLAGRRRFMTWAHRIHREEGRAALDRAVAGLGIRPMAVRDQMRLQLAFLGEALAAVGAA